MVPGAGLEPARPQWPGDFKSPVSTNFTTRAKGKCGGRAGYHAQGQSIPVPMWLKKNFYRTPLRLFGNIAANSNE